MTNDTNPKAQGKSTTEWIAYIATGAVSFISLLAAIGVIATSDQEEVTKMVTSLIGGVGVAVASVASLWRYIESRTKVKVEIIKAEQETEVVTAKAEIANAELRKVELIATMPVEKMSMMNVKT